LQFIRVDRPHLLFVTDNFFFQISFFFSSALVVGLMPLLLLYCPFNHMLYLFQAKQKKNNRKVKDKERDEKCEVKILERLHDEIAVDNSDGLPAVEVTAKVDALEEGSSDGSDMSNRLVKKWLVFFFL